MAGYSSIAITCSSTIPCHALVLGVWETLFGYSGDEMFLQRNLMTATAVVYITTFLFALPLMCHKLGFSSYFRSPTEAYEFLEAQNEERIMNARNFFRNFDGKVDYTHDSQIEFSTVLLTAYRGSNTHYPLQVAARLLPQVINDEGKTVFTVLNFDPQLNEDVAYLSHFVNVINGSAYGNAASRSREKEDYIMGLETALKHNSTYILMLEDDALPSNNLLNNLRFVLNHRMPGRLLKSRRDWAFLKLYYPEKWQGFGWPQVPELLLVGLFGGCLAVWIQLKIERRRRHSISLTFTLWAVYAMLLSYTVGRAHWIELRKLSPFLFSVVQAARCCTPGVLYNRSHARDLANFLNSVQCTEKYPLDFAIDDFADKSNLERYLVVPNMVSHIGVHSSLSNRLKDSAEFFLMFNP